MQIRKLKGMLNASETKIFKSWFWLTTWIPSVYEASHQEPGNFTAWSSLLLMRSPTLCRIHPDKLVPRHWFLERLWENYLDSYSGCKDYRETGRYWEKLSLIGVAFSNLADPRTVAATSSGSRPGENTADVWMVG